MSYKNDWLNYIETCQDPKRALRVFCHNYYYFSLNQILAFSKIIAKISPFDRETLAILAQTIYDELGCGNPAEVHSVLFANFINSIDAHTANQPHTNNVLPGVRNYIEELHAAFSGDSLPRALASYVFLEKSATDSYKPMLDSIRKALPELSTKDLKFFSLHAMLEPDHEKAARTLVAKQNFSANEKNEYSKQYKLLEISWELFWKDIYNATIQTMSKIPIFT